MTFEKDASICRVDLSDGGVVDIADQSVEDEMEVLPTSRPSKVVMVRSNAEEIIH